MLGAEVAQRFAQQLADADEIVDDQVALSAQSMPLSAGFEEVMISLVIMAAAG
jgi:hypothetical protein